MRAVLVVDDSPLVLMTLAEALRDQGMEVIEASSATEALDLLRRIGTPPVLVTDVDLGPGLNGREVARLAREMHAGIGVVFMTGRPASLEQQQLDGHMRVMWKPFAPSSLAAAITEVAAAG